MVDHLFAKRNESAYLLQCLYVYFKSFLNEDKDQILLGRFDRFQKSQGIQKLFSFDLQYVDHQITIPLFTGSDVIDPH